jgi:hypothetical protein
MHGIERDTMFKLHTLALHPARHPAQPTQGAWQDASTERNQWVEGLVFVGIMAYLATGLLSALGVI